MILYLNKSVKAQIELIVFFLINLPYNFLPKFAGKKNLNYYDNLCLGHFPYAKYEVLILIEVNKQGVHKYDKRLFFETTKNSNIFDHYLYTFTIQIACNIYELTKRYEFNQIFSFFSIAVSTVTLNTF